MRRALVLALSALVAAASSVGAQSTRIMLAAPRETAPPRFSTASVAGCFDLSYGPWWFMSGWRGASPATILPSRIVLDTVSVLDRSRFHVLRAGSGATLASGQDVRAAWEMVGGDSVGLTWRRDSLVLDARLGVPRASPSADTLRGLAHASGISPDPFEQPRAVLVATRVPCGSPSRASGDFAVTANDSLAAHREAQADADRIRRGITLNNAQHVHMLISQFRNVRGHVPEKLEELMSVQYSRYPKPDGMWLRDGWGRAFIYFVGPRNYELRSPGPDGVVGSADDIVSKRVIQ